MPLKKIIHGIEIIYNGKTVAPEHLYTLCMECTKAVSKGELILTKKRRRFTAATEMAIMRDTLLKRMQDTFPVPVEQTVGYITKGIRKEYGIRKSHINDARCISTHPLAEPCGTWYLLKKVRCHNRQLHRATIRKGGTRKVNQAPYVVRGFRLFDKVAVHGKEYHICGRRLRGGFMLRTLDGEEMEIAPARLKFIQHQKSFIMERKNAA